MIEPSDLLLIAVINNPRDLEIARFLGWYRIPLRYAPKIIRVDALAFYQTSEFAEEKWSIRYTARVRGVELVRRIDLLQDEPGHPRAMEEYYKFQLSPVIALERPIPARRWKRITFLYTTGEKLLSANSIEDLVINDSEQNVLWGALRDSPLKAEAFEGREFLGWKTALELFLKWRG